MSERKVLNKYYPADFDPTKIPRMKREKNAMYTIRIMAPFNMRCNTCGEYIYKGKKFNSRKETVETETYLGLYIFRFYIRCPRCIAVIAFKTDPENTDYTLEAGATRNFEAARTATELATKEAKAIEEEEANNPMKVLENRTKASRNEMAMLETLEELRDLNKRQANVDYESMTEKYRIYEEQLKQLQDEEDENFVKSIFGEGSRIKRLQEDDEDIDEPTKKINKLEKPTDILAQETSQVKKEKTTFQKGIVTLPKKTALMGLVKRKTTKGPTKDGDKPAEQTLAHKDRPLNESDPLECSTSNSSLVKGVDDGYTNSDEASSSGSTSKVTAPPMGLSLLGNYSDSSNGSDSD